MLVTIAMLPSSCTKSEGFEPFIPPDKIRHSEWRKQEPPRGGMGFRRIHLREQQKARSMWRLVCCHVSSH